MKMKLIVVAVGLGAAVAVGVARGVPFLGAGAGTDTVVTAAAAGDYLDRTSFKGLKLEAWTLGTGVVVRSDKSALGDFELSVQGKNSQRQLRDVLIVGKAAAGIVKSNGTVTFSGTATTKVSDGTPATTGPFVATVTSKAFQLTVNGVALASVSLTAGSIFVG
jgi:hypothetical protein